MRAQAKWVRMSARKARVVAEHIRGRSVPEARAVLAFTQRAAAREIEKVLASAVANAEANHGLVGDELIVHAAVVDEGPTLKRWRARARGRVARINKRTCHITVLSLRGARTVQRRRGAEARRAQAGRSRSHRSRRRRPRPRRPSRKPKDRRRRPSRSPEAAHAAEEGGGGLMGQKIHPGGLRVGVIHDWKSNWYTSAKEFKGALLEDIKIREHINRKLGHAGLSDILIRKDKQRITIDIYTARPGIVIGKSGVEVDALRKDVHAMTHKNVHININEIKRPELDAKLVAQSIAEQLQNRVSFRRAMKRSLASAMRSGAHGVKIKCAGRLGGGEMSRVESYSEGRVPLHTIRADIDYGACEAKTTYGRIGVKVWINKGEIMPEGYEGFSQKDSRLGDQDQARRRGGAHPRGSRPPARAAAAARPTARASARCAGVAAPAAGRPRWPGGGGPGRGAAEAAAHRARLRRRAPTRPRRSLR